MILTQYEEDSPGVSNKQDIGFIMKKLLKVTLNIFRDSAKAPTASLREKMMLTDLAVFLMNCPSIMVGWNISE